MNCGAQKVPQGEGGLSSTQPVSGTCHMHAVYQSVLLPSIMVSLIAIFPSRQVWDVPARAFVPIFVSIRMELVSFVATRRARTRITRYISARAGTIVGSDVNINLSMEERKTETTPGVKEKNVLYGKRA